MLKSLNAIFPKWRNYDIEVSTQEELVFLGLENLSCFQSEWKRHQKFELEKLDELNEELKKLEETTSALSNKELRRMLDKRIEIARGDVAEQQAEVDRIEEIISLLSAAMLIAESKPILPGEREEGYFEKGEHVIFFDSTDGVFYNAVVVAVADVPLNHPMIIYVRNGQAYPCGEKYPPLMKDSEFSYLECHPDYLKVWIKGVRWGIKFDAECMLKKFADL